MKKHIFLFFLLAVLLNLTLVRAQDDVSGMAGYFPANTVFFAATRTDEGFLDWLDKISNVNAFTSAPVPTLRDMLNDALKNANTDLDTLMAWMGDYAAFGVPGGDNPYGQEAYTILEIADRAGAEAFFESNMVSDYTKTSDAEYTIISSQSRDPSVAINDTLAVVYSTTFGFPLRTREARLDTSAAYKKVTGELPADAYNVLLYADPSLAIQDADFPSDILPTGAIALGLTILDNRTYVIDVAQLASDSKQVVTAAAIDPDFARFIPRDASAVIHATDLTALYDNLIDFARTVAAQQPANTAPDPAEQIEQTLAMIGINLREDVLSWTTGDYALFVRTDLLELTGGLVANPNVIPDLNGRIDFGLVIEATDPAKAEVMARKLGLLAKQFGGSVQGLTVADDEINGVDVVVLSLDTAFSATNQFTLDIAIGASDDVLFIATRPAVTSIITGDGTLATSPAYLDAQAYLLPNPTSVWFADSEGMLIGAGGVTVTILALLGPAIGNVFEDIVAGLQTDGTPMPTPTPLPTPTPTPLESLTPEQIAEILQSAVGAITSSSISSTITADGTTLVRFAISTAAP